MRPIILTVAGAVALAVCVTPAGAAVYEYRMNLTAERNEVWMSHSKGRWFDCSPDGDGRWVYASKGGGNLKVAVKGVRVRYRTDDWRSGIDEFRVTRGRVRQAARYDAWVEGSLAGCPSIVTAHQPPDTSGCGTQAMTARRPLRGWLLSPRKGTTVLELAPRGVLFGGRCQSEAPQVFRIEVRSPARAQIAAGRRRVVFKGSKVETLTKRDLATMGMFERAGGGKVTWTWNAVFTRVR